MEVIKGLKPKRLGLKTSFSISLYQSNEHPLHVFLTARDFTKLGVDDSTKPVILRVWCAKKCSHSSPCDHFSSNHNNNDGIFVCAQRADPLSNVARDIESDQSNSSENVTIICTEQFMQHYSFNVHSCSVFVRTVCTPSLKKVVIAVKSEAVFEWACNVKFSTGLLVEVCESNILVRLNDVFLASYPQLFLDDTGFNKDFFFDMKILETIPYCQGLLTVNTELIIYFTGEKPKSNDEILRTQSRKVLAKLPNVENDFYMSDFCQYLRSESQESLKTKHRLSAGSTSSNEDFELTFRVEIVGTESMWSKYLEHSAENMLFDPLYYIGISKQNLLKCGLFHGSLVRISVYDQLLNDSLDFSSGNVSGSSEPRTRERLALVRCLSQQYEYEPKAFISPLLWFNLHNGAPQHDGLMIKMQKYSQKKLPTDVVPSSSISLNARLPIAQKVQISIVNSPTYSPNASYTQAIKKYFYSPRVVSVGDIVAVKSTDDPNFWPNDSDAESRAPIVYFRVIRIEPIKPEYCWYIVDHKSTTLTQMGSVHSHVPVLMENYLSRASTLYWGSIELPGLDVYVQSVEELIKPHLDHKPSPSDIAVLAPSLLITGPSGCGKSSIVNSVACRLGLHVHQENCHFLVGETAASTEMRIRNVFAAASLISPSILLLKDIQVLGKDRDRKEDARVTSSFLDNLYQLTAELREHPVIVMATCSATKQLSQGMHDAFLHCVDIKVPSESQRCQVLAHLLPLIPMSSDVSVEHMSQRTAGFVLGDLVALVQHAKRMAYDRICKLSSVNDDSLSCEMQEDLVAAGIVLDQVDFNLALDELQAAHSDSIGAAKIPDVTWEDVGGLMDVKSDILDTIQMPLQHPELLAAGLRRSGVLLYGPPGSGKTLLAKAVATECSLNFLSVKGPELINMYVGQSEENVREVFQRARSATPCVIFFDELDSLAPNRGRSGDSGGVMDRVVSQLLAELDGLHNACDVFVIGATNRPDLLDPALLRPGRFDKLLYLGVCDNRTSQLKILYALTRRFHLADKFLLNRIVAHCPFTLTGADFYALCSDAMLNTIKRKIEKLDNGEEVDQSKLVVSEEDFLLALENLTPSVTDAELAHFVKLHKFFQGNNETADLDLDTS